MQRKRTLQHELGSTRRPLRIDSQLLSSPPRAAPSSILARFAAVLLDMNGTFMFDEDRFDPDQDFAATYRALGGRGLAAGVVQATIAACCETLAAIYDAPERCDSFPQVLDTLRALPSRDPKVTLTVPWKACEPRRPACVTSITSFRPNHRQRGA